ncbi:MAG: hypothetical protein WA705_17675 [Candidatus Ozemobacteraceae bacterium]
MAEFHDLIPAGKDGLPRKMGGAFGSWDVGQQNASISEEDASDGGEISLGEAGFTSVGPGRIKIDLATPLEQFFLGGAAVSGFGLLMVFFSVIDHKHPMNVGTAKAIGGFCLATAASCLALYRSTDNYYVADLRRRCILYHFQLFFYIHEQIHVPFSQMDAVSATGVKKSSKHSSWWEYQSVVILKGGKKFPVSDFAKENLFEANQKARVLAKICGCRYIPGKHEMELNLFWDSNVGRYQIGHKEPSFLAGGTLLVLILIFVFGLLPILFSLFR